MTTVTVHRPGNMSEDPGNPDYDAWTFTVTVNGRLGVSRILFEHGTSEAMAADMTYTSLMADPSIMEGITSTGPGSHGPGIDGSPSTPGTIWTGPIDKIDDDDDKEPHKMKTADGT